MYYLNNRDKKVENFIFGNLNEWNNKWKEINYLHKKIYTNWKTNLIQKM